ncbi:hypothetical protein Amsp01_055930 [Amycolatopsis sp. NBRC 101858]|nr:hypothetical protein Amsp01_055930 [Amycolatopsis sp. NBRC 101858]
MLSDAQWALIEDLLPVRTGKRGRPFRRTFGPWQTTWTWHRRMAGDGTWDTVLHRLLAEADAAGLVNWSVSVDSTTDPSGRAWSGSHRPARVRGDKAYSSRTIRGNLRDRGITAVIPSRLIRSGNGVVWPLATTNSPSSIDQRSSSMP